MSDTWYPCETVTYLFISLESPGPCWIASRESPWCAYHSRATSYLKPKMHQSWNHGWYSCASFDSKMNHLKFPETTTVEESLDLSLLYDRKVSSKSPHRSRSSANRFCWRHASEQGIRCGHIATLEGSFCSEANQTPRSVKTCRSQRRHPQIKQIGGDSLLPDRQQTRYAWCKNHSIGLLWW